MVILRDIVYTIYFDVSISSYIFNTFSSTGVRTDKVPVMWCDTVCINPVYKWQLIKSGLV